MRLRRRSASSTAHFDHAAVAQLPDHLGDEALRQPGSSSDLAHRRPVVMGDVVGDGDQAGLGGSSQGSLAASTATSRSSRATRNSFVVGAGR
jgi:hypothetical protein